MGLSRPAHSLYAYLLSTTHICFPIIFLKHFLNITLPIKDFTSQLIIGYSPFITIILKRASAQFQLCRHFLVGQIAFTAQHGTVPDRQILNPD